MFRTRLSKPKILTVSELTAQIGSVLESNFDFVAVAGEVSNLRLQSGHWYFVLKDKDAVLSCICFRQAAQQVPFELEDGLQIVAKGRLNIYAPRGSYSLIVSTMQPIGVGEWQLAFEQLKEKLNKEGLLAQERKRTVPLLPQRIGIVTSPTAAALQDILTALKRRNSQVKVLISPCRVQGEGSAEEIAGAIADLAQIKDIDVIIVARGGGSIEDLWSFNTELVARAVSQSPIPVISGVGHETDLTICDLVADLRAPTPTAAAELVAKGRQELLERWSSLSRRLFQSLQERISKARIKLHKLDPRHALLKHVERLSSAKIKVQNRKERLCKAIDLKLANWQNKQTRQKEKLLALSAINVLNRGFSILQKQNGTIIRQASDVRVGETILARLSSGKLRLEVKELADDE